VVRTTLLYGCCAVSDTPAVCACVRSVMLMGFFAELVPHHPGVDAPRGAELGDLLEEVVVHVQKKLSRAAKSSTSIPRVTHSST